MTFPIRRKLVLILGKHFVWYIYNCLCPFYTMFVYWYIHWCQIRIYTIHLLVIVSVFFLYFGNMAHGVELGNLSAFWFKLGKSRAPNQFVLGGKDHVYTDLLGHLHVNKAKYLAKIIQHLWFIAEKCKMFFFLIGIFFFKIGKKTYFWALGI